MNVAAVILAAGQGTRMDSDLPKVLHEIDGRPMVRYVIDTVREIGPEAVVVVVGYKAELVRAACADAGVKFALQAEQLGTGHAVIQSEGALGDFSGTIVVLNGDVPGLRADTLRRFIRHHRESGAQATVLTARMDDPTGYGRIVRGDDGSLQKIVEHKDADSEIRAIDEINSGLFCFESKMLFSALKNTNRENAQNEYYLTDVIEMLNDKHEPVAAYCVDDNREVAGVNTIEELGAIREFLTGNQR